MNEFSVEPPGHSDDEYEIMNQSHSSPQTLALLSPHEPTLSPTGSGPRRPLSLDLNSRHTKSLSLPYMTSPIEGPDESSSEEDPSEVDSNENGYTSDDDDESMFIRSLPTDFFLSTLSGCKEDEGNTGPCSSPDPEPGRDLDKSPDPKASDCEETETADVEGGGGDEDGLEEEQMAKNNDTVHPEVEEMDNNTQR